MPRTAGTLDLLRFGGEVKGLEDTELSVEYLYPSIRVVGSGERMSFTAIEEFLPAGGTTAVATNSNDLAACGLGFMKLLMSVSYRLSRDSNAVFAGRRNVMLIGSELFAHLSLNSRVKRTSGPPVGYRR